MPITKSAKKALRQSEKRASRNRHFTALFRESLKSFDRALVAKDTKAATKLLPEMYSLLDTLVKKNILHINNAARKKSACALKLKVLSTQK
jgi:small subunit ribosomal protein S20